LPDDEAEVATKRALLIGSQTFGLQGVHNDVDLMSRILHERGFEIDARRDGDATRAGILDGYERLIARCSDEDTAVVYFSGHGGYALVGESSSDGGEPRPRQLIVPTDFSLNPANAFNGILDVELSALLGRLTEKTQNTTVVLDCCHAALMSRSITLRPKALPPTWYSRAEVHLATLRESGVIQPTERRLFGNAKAVRLVATELTRSAFEQRFEDGRWHGLLTWALGQVLSTVGAQQPSWAALVRLLRERVQSLEGGQRPDVEGPADRLLFSTTTTPTTGVVGYFRDDAGKPAVRAGRMFGVRVGSKYSVMPAGASVEDARTSLATATVTEVFSDHSRVALTLAGDAEPPEGSPAFPTTTAFRQRGVTLGNCGAHLDAIRRAIAESEHLTIVPDANLADVGLVEVVEGAIAIKRPDGSLAAFPKKADGNGLRETVDNLVQLARALQIRDLEDGGLNPDVEVRWGIVVDGEALPLAPTGEHLFAGDEVFIELTNRGPQRLFVAVYDIGVGGKVSLLNINDSPSGIELGPAQHLAPSGQRHKVASDRLVIPRVPGGKLRGFGASWPKAVPADGGRSEHLLIVIAERPQEFAALQQIGVRSVEPARGSLLERTLDDVATGRSKDLGDPVVGAGDAPGADYAVRRVDFILHPTPRQVVPRRARFALDESLAPTDLVFASETLASDTVPTGLSVRLEEIVVHENRTLGKGRVRVDTLVTTRGSLGEEIVCSETRVFPRVADGDALSLENALIYQGPVGASLNIALWVSKEESNKPPLGELIARVLERPDFQAAATVIGSAVAATPQVAVAVGAAAAVGTVAALVDDVLREAIDPTIAVFHCSHLRHERYGLGAHPSEGLRRAQDISFRYSITDASEDFPRPAAQGDPFQRFRDVRRVSQERFASGEHQWLGQAGMQAACRERKVPHFPYGHIRRESGDEAFSYGELVALSGDFYRKPHELFEAKPSLLPWLWEADDLSDLRRLFRAELDWIEAENRAAGVGYPENNIALAWNAKQYVELALDNVDHFGWHNMVAYCDYHAQALDLARQAAHDDDDPLWRRALFYNAFADHFLTDAFAAGHLRVPRAQILAWGRERGISDKLSGALSKLLHDQDGHIETFHSDGEQISEREGLHVQNAAGVRWSTRCDGQLFIVRDDDAPLVVQPVSAVKASVLELFAAWLDRALPQGYYAATAHVPFPHPDAGTLADKFSITLAPERVSALVKSVSWYMKIPWVGPGLREEHVRDLFGALPGLMARMNEGVDTAIAKNPELSTRLPKAYIDAYRRMA
jgi:hypothetical protein